MRFHFRHGGSSWFETLFMDWVGDGMVVSLNIQHWLHRWDVIKQSHTKYGPFKSVMAEAIMAYNRAT